MIITGARMQGRELVLTCENPLDVAKLVFSFEPGDYELVKVEKKRSLSANAYCWTLINKISEKIHEPPIDIYRRYIRDIGSKVVIACVRIEDMEEEVRTFCAGHIGRMVDVEDSKLPGCVVLHKKYGSSDYSVELMSALIEAIIQDCEALDIPTKTQEEIEKLLIQWRKREKR